MSWLEKILPTITSAVKKNIPEGLWSKCSSCDTTLYEEELKNKFYVCPSCDHHMRINAQTRLEMFLDEGSLVEVAENVETEDPLKFKDQKKYKDRISAAQKATNQKEAIVVRQGTLRE